jgi:hypothetical protein
MVACGGRWEDEMGRRLRLVSSSDPANIFDDLTKLQQDQREPASRRRQRSTETFARIPHNLALDLYHHRLSAAAWLVLIELDRLILKHRGQNPVKLVSSRLRKAGLHSQTRARALRQLVDAKVIKVEPQGKGLGPWITHLWFPLQD